MSLSYTIAPADNNGSVTTVVKLLKIVSCSSTGDMFADNNGSVTTVVKLLKIVSCSSTGDMFAENNPSVAIYSSYSVGTVESTVVLIKSKRSFCKSLVVTK